MGTKMYLGSLLRGTVELKYFDREHENRSLDWYKAQFPPAEPDQLLFEKSPSYFPNREVPQRIYDTDPNIKFILIVRDPVNRSAFFFNLDLNANVISLSRFISDIVQRNTGRLRFMRNRIPRPLDEHLFDGTLVAKENRAVKCGMYAVHLKRWLEVFPLSQILIVESERFVAEPWAELQRAEQFLGLQHELTEEHFVYNATKGFYCYREGEGAREQCLTRAKGREHPRLPLDLEMELKDFYASYNREFAALTGQTFSWTNAY